MAPRFVILRVSSMRKLNKEDEEEKKGHKQMSYVIRNKNLKRSLLAVEIHLQLKLDI